MILVGSILLHPMGRAPCCSKIGLNRGPWTPEEDALLAKHIEAYGEGCWKELPKAAGLLRCGKSCRLRWVNYLRPTVKRGNISEDEEDLIIKLHSLLGNRWSLIAARIPGRTDNEIKNYWNTHLSKKLTRKGIDPKTHKRLVETTRPKKSPKLDHRVSNEPLSINLDPIATDPGNPSIGDSDTATALSTSGLDCDCHREISNFGAPTKLTGIVDVINVDNEGEIPQRASSIELEGDLLNHTQVIQGCSSYIGLEKCSSSSKDLIVSSDYDYASSPSFIPLKTHQVAQPDRNESHCRRSQESVSTDTVSASSKHFAYLGLPSSLVLSFDLQETKSLSPSSDACAVLSGCAGTEITVSCFNFGRPKIVNNVINSSRFNPASLDLLSLQDEKTYEIESPVGSSKADTKRNYFTENSSDNAFSLLSKDIDAQLLPHHVHVSIPNIPEVQLLFLEERPEIRETWNCADKSASAEYAEITGCPLLKRSDCSNISVAGCSESYFDLHESFDNFEWRHFNLFGCDDL